jgi:hypothetical protein
MNKVTHFEIPFDDKERAQKFYSETFGWKFDDMPEIGYTGIMTTPADETGMPTTPGAINGGLTARDKSVATPVITIDVDSIDEYIKKVEAAGGQLVRPKGEVPQMGYYAYVKDSEGNVIGLWQNI